MTRPDRDFSPVFYAGYVIEPGVPLEDYQDYYGKQLRMADIAMDLKNGNLPVGLVLRDSYGTTAIVTAEGLRRI